MDLDQELSSGDEEEQTIPHTCVLIVGQSNSGKSSLVRQLISEFKNHDRKVWVLNDNTNDSRYAKIAWEDVDSLQSAILVVEDIICLNSRKYAILSHIVSYLCHHQSVQPCYIISHSLLKQNIFSLISFMTHIYLSACPSNMASLRALLNFYSFEKSAKDFYLKQMKEVSQEYSHFLFTVKTQTFELVRYPFKPPEEDKEEEEEEEEEEEVGQKTSEADKLARQKQRKAEKARDRIAMERAKRFLSVGAAFGSKEKSEAALVIFEIMYPFLPKHKINVHNLTITLKTSSGSDVVVSIVDYLSCLCHEDSDPSPNVRRFHDFVRNVKNIHISQCFIANRLFWD